VSRWSGVGKEPRPSDIRFAAAIRREHALLGQSNRTCKGRTRPAPDVNQDFADEGSLASADTRDSQVNITHVPDVVLMSMRDQYSIYGRTFWVVTAQVRKVVCRIGLPMVPKGI
jgi:hypothetical protein